MNTAAKATKHLVKAPPMRPTDSAEKMALRMVLHTHMGGRVTLSPEGTPNFCRFMLAYDDAKCVFWGRINGRSFTAYNGETAALAVVKAWMASQRNVYGDIVMSTATYTVPTQEGLGYCKAVA